MAKLHQEWCGEYEERTVEQAHCILKDGSGPIFVSADDEEFESPDDTTCFSVGDPEHEDSTERFQFVVANDEDTVATFRKASDALWFAMQVTDKAAELVPKL